VVYKEIWMGGMGQVDDVLFPGLQHPSSCTGLLLRS